MGREMGLEAELKENLTLEEINSSVSRGIPIIEDCQAWKSPAEGNLTCANDWGRRPLDYYHWQG